MHCTRAAHAASRSWTSLALLAAIALLATAGPARADSGFYVGAGIGTAVFEAKAADSEFDLDLDEDDFAKKVFVGYNIDAFVIDLAVEGGYVDFGNPTETVLGSEVGIDVTGWDVFGLAGIGLGPVGLFAKAGVISWDGDATVNGVRVASDSGTDPAYGLGVRFRLWSAEVRAEYEYFDVDAIEHLSMLSVSVAWTF
jgi:outer membrane immunogenic protein